ncbi:MAG: phosphoglucosamine mutase, partial [Chthonomonadales bacterium]
MSDEPRFGTDGVRGVANKELTSFLALRLGMAAASVLGRHSVHNKVVVGRDTRLSGEMLESAIVSGLSAMGADVQLAGVIPTPGVARSILKVGASAGAVISASHNPFEDNGIKFFGADAHKLSDEVEEEIELALENWSDLPFATPEKIGRIKWNNELSHSYSSDVLKCGPDLTGLKIVLDCANGAASAFAHAIFSQLGATVLTIHNSPDGVNINLNCGSTRTSDVRNKVVATGADVGLAF